MKKKVVLAGGTGFIGQYVEKKLVEEGYDIAIISRQPEHIGWKNHLGIVEALEGASMLINLAGKSVNCRYNEKNKRAIYNSRTETTEALGIALMACENPPPLWINASTATIYRHAEDRPMTEAIGEFGTGFSVDVAKAWEQALFSFDLPQTRQVALRIAIVLGEDGGVMEPYINLVRFGLGGKQGNGHQMFSWIHIEDLYRIMMFLKEREDLSGVFNCASPHPITNRQMMKAMRDAMDRRIGVPSPSWLLEIGAVFIRTETELIFKSRWVVPERLLREGFHFHFERIEEALGDILTSTK